MGCGCNKISTSTSTGTVNIGTNYYVPFTQASELFMNRFSLSQIDFDTSRTELIPYYTAILQYLNYRLTILGSDDMKTQLCEVFDIFDEGAQAICQSTNYKTLMQEIVESADYSSVCGEVAYLIKAHKTGGTKETWEIADTLYELYSDYVEENQLEWPEDVEVFENATEWAANIGITIPECGVERDRFIFAWSHAMTAICMRLRFQYAGLWDQEAESGDCCNCGGKGETTDDYESWVSNVYSNDEEYDRTNYTRTNSAWQISKNRICDCYRHSSETSDTDDNDNDGQYTSLSSLFNSSKS